MMRIRLALSLTAAACVASSAWAIDLVKPNGELPLRDAPPGSFFQGKGVTIDTARPSDKFMVLERRVVPTISGRENWLRVKSVGGPAKEGWVFSGTDNPNANFSPAQ